MAVAVKGMSAVNSPRLSAIGQERGNIVIRFLRIMVAFVVLLVPVLSFADANLDACWNFSKASDYSRAVEHAKKATKSSPKNYESFYCLGYSLRMAGELNSALSAFKKAEELTSDKEALMYIYNQQGIVLSTTGEEEQALQEYSRYLSIAKELGRTGDEGTALANIADIYHNRGQLDQSLEYYQKALQLTEDEKSAPVYNNMGLLYASKGDTDKAVEYIKRAIEIDEKKGDYHAQAIHLLNLGSIQTRLREFSLANDSLFQGLDKVRKVKDAYWEAVADVYLGRLYRDMGNIPLARKWFSAAIDIYSKIGAAADLANTRAAFEDLSQPRPYGGIEIGAKGVKASVLIIKPLPEGSYDVDEALRKTINTTIFAGVKTKGAFEPQAIDETANAVKELFDLMVGSYKVDMKNIYLVGSSAVAKATNRDALTEKVKQLTGAKLTYITKDDEVLYNVVGSIPADKIAKALSVDIGSGNTKIGYWDRANGRDNVVAVEVPLGTVSLSDAVAKAGDDPKALSNAADKVIHEELAPRLKAEMQRRPGYRNRRPVYLVGGIVWAVATLTKPGDRKDFTKLTPADVDKVIAGLNKNPDALLNPSLSHIKDPEIKKWAESQINSVKDVFTPENMLSGAKLLKAVFTEMKIKEGYFARWGSWVAGKVYLQAYDAEEQAAKLAN
ncbi:tetratricopeptide repeat protein [Geomonas subterranea]|uniref:Tetratricopeptide repeat protein n=1 Tax=Geomonas subterranea TaxID=2847989 RepID=A0ABX8LC40_9BACT|nr:tetratricopeptide repeat protein [Geomonas subterranea]QXE89583.1 tetratricopeptide repeat protein [Geomonas subterranea]QXM08300.1 tetratricopeptide repeat protein [Geomonas subterranea]